MSTKTPNYNLTLPAQEDYYNVDIFNDNYEIIDGALKELDQGKAEADHVHLYAGSSTAGGKANSAASADSLSEYRAIRLTGGATGSYDDFDGTDDADIEVTEIDPDYLGKPVPVSKGGTGNSSVDQSPTNGSSKMVTSGGVYTALGSKANTDHSHSLSSNTITGTLPISKGGTGATSAINARTNLGLGSAATMNYTTSVASGSTNLVTSQAVYNAINSINVSNRTHIVIGTYDTQNPLKEKADYICTSDNATSIIKTAISNIARGGTIELLDGTYNLQYSAEPIELNKQGICIKGANGFTSVINQPADEESGEAKEIFNISANDITIRNLMLCDSNVSSPVSLIKQGEEGVIYDNIFFIFNASESSSDNACITGRANCKYTRIQNCRVYKGFTDLNKVMFDFSNCTGFSGIIGGNISSGYDGISVKFANEGEKNNTVVYGNTAIDLQTKGN